MLHIITTTTGHEVLLQRISRGDALLFVESAVLSLHKNSHYSQILLHLLQHCQCYALEADLLARGLAADRILAEVAVVDYQGFVNLTVKHAVIKTWN